MSSQQITSDLVLTYLQAKRKYVLQKTITKDSTRKQ